MIFAETDAIELEIITIPTLNPTKPDAEIINISFTAFMDVLCVGTQANSIGIRFSKAIEIKAILSFFKSTEHRMDDKKATVHEWR